MRKRLATLALLVALGLAGTVSVASASPGPGDSNQCAPGQHSGPEKPPPCPPN
jgi:hypothetical protein